MNKFSSKPSAKITPDDRQSSKRSRLESDKYQRLLKGGVRTVTLALSLNRVERLQVINGLLPRILARHIPRSRALGGGHA